MKKSTLCIALISGWISAQQGFAASIQCNKSQSQCVVESKDFTIGDHVGLLNEQDELVAIGVIKALHGEKRTVAIKKRHGTIASEHRIALLSNNASGDQISSYKTYKEPAKYRLGANLDYGIVSVASGAPGIALSGFGTMRYAGGLEFVGRGLYASYSTPLSLIDAKSSGDVPYEMRQLALLGGVGYRLLESNPVSFRGEFTLGLANIAATIDGDPSLVDNELNKRAKVKNGWAPMGRWSVGVTYRIHKYLISADAVQSLVHEALASSFSFGASIDLK